MLKVTLMLREVYADRISEERTFRIGSRETKGFMRLPVVTSPRGENLLKFSWVNWSGLPDYRQACAASQLSAAAHFTSASRLSAPGLDGPRGGLRGGSDNRPAMVLGRSRRISRRRSDNIDGGGGDNRVGRRICGGFHARRLPDHRSEAHFSAAATVATAVWAAYGSMR